MNKFLGGLMLFIAGCQTSTFLFVVGVARTDGEPSRLLLVVVPLGILVILQFGTYCLWKA